MEAVSPSETQKFVDEGPQKCHHLVFRGDCFQRQTCQETGHVREERGMYSTQVCPFTA